MAEPVLWVVERKYGDEWMATSMTWFDRKNARNEAKRQNSFNDWKHRVAKYARVEKGGKDG